MKKFLAKLLVASLLAFSAQGFFLTRPPELDANLSSVKDTLSSSRLSFYGKLASGNSVGSSLVILANSGAPSTANYNLFPNDSVWIGTAGTGTSYTVDQVYDDANDDTFQLTAGLGASDADADDLVIASRSAIHTISFTTASAIADGAIRILIPSGTNNTTDGVPNHDGFDFNSITGSNLTKPTGGGPHGWEDPTATASGGAGCTAGNHCFESRYNGTTNVSAALTFTIGDATTSLINPTPGTGHSTGTADTYSVTVQHLNDRLNDYEVIDETTVKIAVIESVRVTATVSPSITFTIAGVAVGITACEQTLDITSTATTVPYSTVTLSTFMDAAQQLSVVTNAIGGYAVTMISDDQLSISGDHSTEIPNTDCDAEDCTDTTSGEWSSENSVSGFGFSLHNIDASTAPFYYRTVVGSCTGGAGDFCARMIPSTATTSEPPDDSDTALEIMSDSSTPASTENLYVCYRLAVGTTQPAGNYENNITYTATATF
jgi:hypothetical protein